MFRALIIEDSPFFRQLLKDTLQSNFSTMEVMEAIDGQNLLIKIDNFPPDLVFMDINLNDAKKTP